MRSSSLLVWALGLVLAVAAVVAPSASAAPHHQGLRKAQAAEGPADGDDVVEAALDDAPKQWWGNGTNSGAAPAALDITWPVPQYRGVNLGGWLVLESWMYPEWWRATGVPFWKGEHQFVEALGKEKARALLEKHWDTWVTKGELKTLKDAGITHLRIPIGYWILGPEWLTEGEAYLPGAWTYLERALGWCKELGLKTIIDLHGAPGVQNGNDNGGFSGGHDSIHWHEPKYLQKTTDVLVALAKNLTATNATEAYAGTVEGLCLINEPWTTVVGGPIKLETVRDWTKSAVDALLAAGWKGSMWFPDGFQVTWEGWQGFLQPPQYQNVYADSHFYLLFDPALAKEGPEGLIKYVCQGWFREQLVKAHGRVASGVVVGEYSLDFKSYPSLTGQLTDAQQEGLQQLLLAEQRQFGVIGPSPSGNAAVGGFFWSFKSFGTVGKAEGQTAHSPWSYLALIKDGIAPPDLGTASFDCAAVAGDGTPIVQATPGVGTAGGPGNDGGRRRRA